MMQQAASTDVTESRLNMRTDSPRLRNTTTFSSTDTVAALDAAEMSW